MRGAKVPSASTRIVVLAGSSLRLRYRGALVWGVYLAALGIAYVALYPSLADQRELLNGLVGRLPRAARSLFGFGAGAGFGSIEALLATELLGFMAPLALAFFAILASASALSGAEEDGKIDVVMSNPIARWQLVVGSFVASMLSLAIILAVMGVLMELAALVVGVDLSPARLAEALLNLWPMSALFGGFAMLCSALTHRRAPAVSIPGAVLVFMYILNALAGSVGSIEGLRRFSAFHYYGAAIRQGIDWSNFALLSASALLLVVLAALAFGRRDVYT